MGDFDRNETPGKKNETKKMVAVVALGAVLVGLVAMQFTKNGGPQAAAGAPAISGVALPPPVVTEEISASALAGMMNDLQNDPTKPLLRQDSAPDAQLDVPPRNPFYLSNSWLGQLVKPVIVPTPPQPAPQPRPEPPPPIATRPYVPPPVTIPAPQAPLLRPEDFKLSSIVNGNTAFINGKVVKVGDVVGKARVIDIRPDGVTLQPADFPNAPKTELSMQSRLNLE